MNSGSVPKLATNRSVNKRDLEGKGGGERKPENSRVFQILLSFWDKV